MYNSNYWEVMGSASPTILLAAIIALGNILPVQKKSAPRNRSPIRAVIGYTAMMVQVSVLWLSLYSLGQETDAVPTSVATGLELGGVLLLIAASGFPADSQNTSDSKEDIPDK